MIGPILPPMCDGLGRILVLVGDVEYGVYVLPGATAGEVLESVGRQVNFGPGVKATLFCNSVGLNAGDQVPMGADCSYEVVLVGDGV